MSLSDSGSTSVRDNGLIEIVGADGTPIGNVSDRLKVTLNDFSGPHRTVNNNSTSRSFSSSVPLISLRNTSTTQVKIIDFGVFVGSADDLLVTVILNPTLTSASWTAVSGVCEKDVSATETTGGTALYSFYVRGAAGASSTTVLDAFRHTIDLRLNQNDIVTLNAVSVSGSTNAYGNINYQEAT